MAQTTLEQSEPVLSRLSDQASLDAVPQTNLEVYETNLEAQMADHQIPQAITLFPVLVKIDNAHYLDQPNALLYSSFCSGQHSMCLAAPLVIHSATAACLDKPEWVVQNSTDQWHAKTCSAAWLVCQIYVDRS